MNVIIEFSEPLGYRIIGIDFENGYEISRIHIWDIRPAVAVAVAVESGEKISPL